MRALITGVAGFIGSHLAEHLLSHGDEVVGVDALTDFYPIGWKQENLRPLLDDERFSFVQDDIRTSPDLSAMLDGVDVAYHLAAQPGVRPSWGRNFEHYVHQNIQATQRLLEVARGRLALRKLVYASSSSVYGNAESLPTTETMRPLPMSPYGVTKLAAEHLCELYRANFGVPTASLRLFTVYGPRQRPDMAFSRLFAAAVERKPFPLYGDGMQSRDFTFVTDVVRAMRDVATSEWHGVANVGGGTRATMNDVIDIVEALVGPVTLIRGPVQKGDVRHTAADTSVAARAFGFAPAVSLAEGLEAMAAWALDRRRVVVP